MKGTRLKDVLDNKVVDKTFWDMVFGKLKKLGTAIEMFKGTEMSIDDRDYRWVQDRIEYWNSEERILSRSEMIAANTLWDRYGK